MSGQRKSIGSGPSGAADAFLARSVHTVQGQMVLATYFPLPLFLNIKHGLSSCFDGIDGVKDFKFPTNSIEDKQKATLHELTFRGEKVKSGEVKAVMACEPLIEKRGTCICCAVECNTSALSHPAKLRAIDAAVGVAY